MGAVTVSIVKRQPMGGTARSVIADVTFSGSYAAGGDTYTPSQFGLTTVNYIAPTAAAASTTTGFVVLPDIPNSKLRLLGGAASGIAMAESGVAGQTGTVARLFVVGDAPYI